MTRALTTRRAGVRAGIGAATVAGVAAVAWTHRGDPTVALLLSTAVLCYGALSAVDAAEQRLPNRITLPLAAATLGVVVASAVLRSDVMTAVGAIATGLAFAVVLLALRFGMGDVKLALTVGMVAGWLGQTAVVATVVAGASAGAAAAVVLIVVHRQRHLTFGFGPALAIGSVAGMMAAHS